MLFAFVKFCYYFNPRPREEGDETTVFDGQTFTISIHALVKRATKSPSVRGFVLRISIHALVKRATTSAKQLMG